MRRVRDHKKIRASHRADSLIEYSETKARKYFHGDHMLEILLQNVLNYFSSEKNER